MSDVASTSSSRGVERVARPVLILLAIMWAAELLDLILPVDADSWGIRSRSIPGLLGIPLAPFLHVGFGHLLANTVPLLVLGMLVSWRAGSRFWGVVVTIVLVSGLAVWLLGPADAVTVGASGLVFGLLTYLLTAGVLTRHWVDVLLAVVVLLVYGSMLWGALPFFVPSGVSWLGHLGGAAGGIAAGLLFVGPRAGSGAGG